MPRSVRISDSRQASETKAAHRDLFEVLRERGCEGDEVIAVSLDE
jgi:hypothetical protein